MVLGEADHDVWIQAIKILVSFNSFVHSFFFRLMQTLN